MRVVAWLSRQPKALVFAAGLPLVALLGGIDYLTGPDLSLAICYVVPIFVVTWASGRVPGVLLSGVCAGVWLLSDLAAGHAYPHPLIPYWNALVHLAFFGVLTYLLTLVRPLQADNRRLVQEVQQALRTRDEFLAVAVHELKRPLAALITALHLLQQRLWSAPDVAEPRDREVCSLAMGAAEQLSLLVETLAGFVQVESGALRLQVQALDLGALVADVVAQIERTLDSHVIQVERGATPVIIAGDADQLQLVVSNLVQNAIKYSRPGSRVRVAVAVHGGEAWLVVQDQGIGIPRAEQGRLFEQFYRASNAQRATASGLGIGLSLVQAIVRWHQGVVEVSSVEGQGSTFTVRLPAGSPR